MIGLLLNKGVKFDITAFRALDVHKRSDYSSFPEYDKNITRAEATVQLLTEKKCIKKGDNGQIIPYDTESLISGTLDALKEFNVTFKNGYIRARHVFDEKYNKGVDPAEDEVGTYFTQVNNTSLDKEIQKKT